MITKRPRYALGALARPMLRWRNWSTAGRTVCLAYHDVPERHLGTLRAQVAAVLRFHRPLTLDEFCRRLECGKRCHDAGVLFTFDDGFRSNRRATEAVLAEFGIKAVFFIPTGFVDCQSPREWDDYICRNLHSGRCSRDKLPEDLQPMNWEDLRALAAQGHAIGAHTIKHPSLASVSDPQRLGVEIEGSGEILEERLGFGIDAFAFPFGTLSSIGLEAVNLARRRYRVVFTGIRGDNRTAFNNICYRESVSADEPVPYVMFQAAGGLWPYYWNDRRKLMRLCKRAGQHAAVPAGKA